jgi:tetratricopeptide (TPR) repeat protein
MNRKQRRLKTKQSKDKAPSIDKRFKHGLRCMDENRYDQAADLFVSIMKEQPDHYPSIEQIGVISKELGQYDKAANFFKAVTELNPFSTEAYGHYATCMIELDRIDEAIAFFSEALKRSAPSYAYLGLANCYLYSGKKDLAKRYALQALERTPDDPDCLYEYLNSYHNFSDKDDKYLRKLHAIEKSSINELTDIKKARIYTLLYKAYDAIGDYDTAFNYATKAGEIRKSISQYDSNKATLLHQLRIKYYDKDFFFNQAPSSNNSQKPVFILGMPRSGTTLLEQILHAHKDIQGIGENIHLAKLINEKSLLPPSNDVPYLHRKTPENRETLSLDEIAKIHLDYLDQRAPNALRVVDKSISNLILAGIINRIYPNAYMIYIKRNPLSSCLSTFVRHFNQGSQPYSNDLNDLGLAYAQHCELIKHWKDVLPIKIFEISYEDLVTDTESKARELIAFLGLKWDPNCLNFHEEKKVVKTASLDQVRKPIYNSSLQSWKKYKKHLKPLITALGPYGPELAE